MAEDPPPQPPEQGMMPETKIPAQAVNEAVDDTPVPVSTKAAELKFSGSVDASSSSTSLPISTGHNHSTNGLSSGLDQN